MLQYKPSYKPPHPQEAPVNCQARLIWTQLGSHQPSRQHASRDKIDLWQQSLVRAQPTDQPQATQLKLHNSTVQDQLSAALGAGAGGNTAALQEVPLWPIQIPRHSLL